MAETKGLARGWGEGAPSPSRVSGCVASAGQALVGRKGPPFLGLTCPRALPETLKGTMGPLLPINAATISEIYFGICSRFHLALSPAGHRQRNFKLATCAPKGSFR